MTKVKTNLRIAIQKKGRLTPDTVDLLKSAGLEFDAYAERLYATCENFPLEILFVRDDDIPNYVQEGTADLGIVGKNEVIEHKVKVNELLALRFGHCKLTVAVPKDSSVHKLEQLAHKKIATSYPNSTKAYFHSLGIPVEVIVINGSVELTPAIGVADAISDLSASGYSMKVNDLRPIADIYETQAVMIANNKSVRDSQKSAQIDLLLRRLNSVLVAKRYKYIMMNLPKDALDKIRDLTPGLRSPTVIPLANPDWVAVHSVIHEDVFWEVIEELKKVGAEGILVSQIENLIA